MTNGPHDFDISSSEYEVKANSFGPIQSDSAEFQLLERMAEEWEGVSGAVRMNLSGPKEQWKERLVYTIAQDLSEDDDSTIPVIEVQMRPFDLEEDGHPKGSRYANIQPTDRDRFRALFIEEDQHGRVTGLGPIGKAVKISQSGRAILFLRDVDYLSGKAQSSLFPILDNTPRIQYGQGIEGDTDNLTIFLSTNPEDDREELDFKFRDLLGRHVTQESISN